ncbi:MULTISPECIES: protein YgfX [Erwinia]|uniref:Protein YgfX n=1 Tax=Erwinia aeris TaxID=3239803 RepID=A0ABV4E9N4_9GAMM|nr:MULTISPECIES: protein YgfX [unclassified Erwinia]MDN4628287.1 protein YgfX [Erwinia sp. PsM31]MDN8541714.1 protein YgfX [Erwinia sp. BC051422]
MALWRSDLRVSWQAQWMSLSLHGVVVIALLLAPWPASLTVVWMLLLTLVVLECVRSQRRIRSREGDIALLADHQLQWRQKHWRICGRPWMTRRAILLALRSAKGEREKLWLLRDSMNESEWRQLRQQLLAIH